MTHRYSRVLLWLLVFMAIRSTSLERPQAFALGAEFLPLPPNPDDWVCKDSISVVTPADMDQWCRQQVFRGLPIPAPLRVPPSEAELGAKNLFDVVYQSFLRSRAYATILKWTRDQSWRLTGPYVGTFPIDGSGASYGVHPAVRIYYSPEMIDWLCSDRTGTIPDGAMIIKEMHPINASLNITVDANRCMDIQADVEPTSWTVMIKASRASQDGWYWANYAAAPQPPAA